MKYKELFYKAKEIVNKADPLGLISGGAPDDQFDDEIAKILIVLKNVKDSQELESEIAKIFQSSFKETFEPSEFKEVSLQIFSLKS
jgi:hypothetical protein